MLQRQPPPTAPPLILSVFATFAAGGPQVRFAELANHFGPRWRHGVIALDGRTDCAVRIGSHVPFSLVPAPGPGGSPLLRLRAIRRTLRTLRPALLLTSNWGSIEWVAVARTLPGLAQLHTEDGFNPDEAFGQKRRRVLARRLLLRGLDVVLPSQTLFAIARDVWRLPRRGLHYIPNGLDLVRFRAAGPRAGLDVPGTGPLIGTVAHLRAEKNLARLLRAVALLHRDGSACRLVLIGDGQERPRLEALAAELGIAHLTRFAGKVDDPADAYRALDLFVLSSDTEQMPFSILEAMASGLAVAATDVGDVAAMLAAEQRPFVVTPSDEALAGALRALVANAGLRARLGQANRAKAERDFSRETMFETYAELIHSMIAEDIR